MQDETSGDDDRTQPLDDAAPTVPALRQSRASTGRSAFEIGHVVAGRYRILRFIARGGMGEVYEAEDLELHGSVALKTIRPEVAEDSMAIERFRREIQIARKVTHPNVCRVFDVDHDQSTGADVIFVTMELLEGKTLRQFIVNDGPLSLADALPIAKQIADGLHAAHRAGVVHRDLKSANVMLVDEPGQKTPRVVVTDFGLARASVISGHTITNSGDIIGSPAYMAPEQIEGTAIAPATDIYALGVVLFEMITRAHPFEADTPLASVLKRLREPPTSPRAFLPDLDPAWEHTILRCLERDPADRFADAREAVQALESGTTQTLPSRRRARLRALAIVLGMLAILIAIALFWQRREIEPAPVVTRTAPARRAIAVIGFKNQSGQKDVEWLSTALTEMLTTEVAAAEQVRTIPGETVARTMRELGAHQNLPQLRTALGTDYIVSGSYTTIGSAQARQLRLDIQLQEALGGNVITSFAETGTEERLFELVSRTGSRLREKLGVNAVTPEAASGILASLPSNPAAVRYYAEGLDAYRAYDNLTAREKLEKAIAADPNFPLAHAALADVHHALGYDARAKQEAQVALDHAAKLPRESRLVIEAQAHVQNNRYAQAAEIYQALWRFYPDNLDYAMRTASALDNSGRAKEALALVDGLKKTWNDPRVDLAEADAAEAVSDYKRARDAARRAVQKAEARGQRLLAARARLTEGYAYLRMSELPAARAAFEDCKRRYESAGDRAGVGQALGGIGAVLFNNEQFDEALAIFRAQLEIARETGSRAGEAGDLYNMAMVLHRQGDLAGAKTHLERALALQQEIANPKGIAGALSMLANVSADAGDLTKAEELYRQALALDEKIGAAHAAANERNNLANLRKTKGDLDGSERLFREALAGFKQTHDDVAVADVLNNLAAVQRARGDIAGAEQSYRDAEQVYRRMNSESDLALIAVNISTIFVDRGDLANAKKEAERALTIWRSTGEKSYELYAVMQAGDVEYRRGDLARAAAMFRDALAQRQKMGEQSTVAESELALAELAIEQGQADEAEKLARSALTTFEKDERADVTALAKAILCRAAIARGDFSAARRLLQSADTLAAASGDAPARFAVAMSEARLAIATGKAQLAIEKLNALKKKATVPQQLDARLALIEAHRAAGHNVKTQIESLEWDANKRGFGWVAKKAATLR